MPAFLWALGGLLLNIVGSVAGRALLALGMGYVTYKGFDIGVNWLHTQIKDNIGAMPMDIIDFLAFLWVDKAIGMIFSAYAAASLIKMAGGNSFTKLVTKG